MVSGTANHEGGCVCGALRYRVTAEPVRMSVCHCRFCQRQTGSAFHIGAVFRTPDFAFTAGSPRVYAHRSTGSGNALNMHFCEVCGTKVAMTFERFPDVTCVYAGTFDDPDWVTPTPENSRQIFLAYARRGTIIPPGVPTFHEYATTLDGAPIEPTIYDEPHIIGGDER